MVDEVCQVPRVPRPGEGVVALSRERRLGGCAFNSANAIRQLGGAYALFAPVGTGSAAAFVRAELSARGMAGVEVGGARDNGSCLCMIEPDGERTMLTFQGIDRFFEPAWFEGLDTRPFGIALASGYEIEGAGGAAIVSFLEAHPEIAYFHAPGPCITRIDSALTARINALHPVWHVNDAEARAYAGCERLEDAGRAIAAQTGGVVVVTAGAAGAYAFGAEGADAIGMLHVPTAPTDPLDTTGAGDAHLGALAFARARGMGWKDALALANRVAGAVCRVQGATLSDEEFSALVRL